MHSDSIIKTLDTGQNRFELCHQAFKAVRKLHNPGNRIQDTTKDALQRLAGAERQEVSVDPQDANQAALESQSGVRRAELITDVPPTGPGGLIPTEYPATATELRAPIR
jgi:hypothetical protein